jgi:type IV pilus assembly protein PilW
MRSQWQQQPRRHAGLTLVELMIAMALGMAVALTAMTLLGAVKRSYLGIHDSVAIQDTGRYALEVIAEAIRQANFIPRDDPAVALLDPASLPPGVSGLDNSRLASNTPGLSAPQSNSAHHRSDVLALRFFGAAGDTQRNCAGFAIAPPTSNGSSLNAGALDQQRGWSIFYIAADSSGMPELRCKYSTRNHSWNAAAVARGIEAMHVLYGIGSAQEVEQYLPAMQMSAAQWRQVLAVRFAVLVRGEYVTQPDTGSSVHHLFGSGYQNGDDGVVTIKAGDQAGKLRKVFGMTVRLRNPAS